jgi:hypothetical protein
MMRVIFGMDQGMPFFHDLWVPVLMRPYLPAMNSIIKSHFAWNWQLATLNHGDELVCLPLAFLQPYMIWLSDTSYSNGKPVSISRSVFGVLSMVWDTKTVNVDVGTTSYCLILHQAQADHAVSPEK